MKKFTLENAAPIRVVYIELSGPYEKWGKGLEVLTSWLKTNGIRTEGPPIGLFYDNPLETPPEKLRSEACMPVDTSVPPSDRFKVKVLAGGTLAVTRHNGPPERYTETYGAFLEDILGNGFVLLGPAREVFDRPRSDLRPGMGVAIKQPISRR